LNGVSNYPLGVFSFACLPRAHRPARIEPPLRQEAFRFSMCASFSRARAAALSFLESIIAQILKKCKKYIEKSPKGPEFQAFARIPRPDLAGEGRGEGP
jgi:hypothetical protein